MKALLVSIPVRGIEAVHIKMSVHTVHQIFCHLSIVTFYFVYRINKDHAASENCSTDSNRAG